MMKPVLVILDLDKKMRVEANVSDFAMEKVLSMKCEDKGILAIIRCLEAQKHFLEEAKNQFEIWIDYKNLEYFMKAQKLNQRQARQVLYLLRFDFALKHITGKSIG